MSKYLTFLASIFLLFSILTLPSAQSQAYTTITTQSTSLFTTYETSLTTVSETSTLTGPVDIFQHYVGKLFVGGTIPSDFSSDLRNVSLGVHLTGLTLCYFLAASINATEGQTLSGYVGLGNVPVGLFITDDASFNFSGVSFLVYSACSFDALPSNLKTIVSLRAPYVPYPTKGYVAPPQNYVVTIPSTGRWWVVGYVDGRKVWPTLIGSVKWSWSAYLSPPTPYATTVTSFNTATNPIILPTTVNLLQTQQVGQAFSFSAEQLYAGLATVFGVLLVVTMGLLLKQRQGRPKK